MTLKAKYSEHVLNGKQFTSAENVAFKILSDLTRRRDLCQSWEGINENTQEKILKAWVKIGEKQEKYNV